MLCKTPGLVLTSVRYGDNSLVVKIFTRQFGLQSYLVQGVRGGRTKGNKAAFFQPGTMLDLVLYNQPGKNLQRISEFTPLFLYKTVQQEVVKNCILLFVVEFLGKLLSEQGPMEDFFDFSVGLLQQMDQLPSRDIANFPLYFSVACSRFLGFDLAEIFEEETTPHLKGINSRAGGSFAILFTLPEQQALSALYQVREWTELSNIALNGELRLQLIEKLATFYLNEMHGQGQLKSLPVLKAILQ